MARKSLPEVYCPALAADGERYPFAIPARGWLWRRDRVTCSACGTPLPSGTHPAFGDHTDDAAIAALVRERDAADDGTRITLDELLAEHGIERRSLRP